MLFFSVPNCVLSATTLPGPGPGLGSSAVLPPLLPSALPLLRGQASCLLSTTASSEAGGALSALHHGHCSEVPLPLSSITISSLAHEYK